MPAAVLEIRTYRLRPGCLDAFDRTMRDRSVPLLDTFGIDVVHAAPSRSAEDGVVDYVLIRRYPTYAERDRQETAFYSSAQWRDGPAAAIVCAIDSYHTVTLTVDDEAIEALRASLVGDTRPAQAAEAAGLF